MAYNDYRELISPGDAFSQGFDHVLQQQAALKRQAMLDEIASRREQRLEEADRLDNEIRRNALTQKVSEDKQKEANAFVTHYMKTHVAGDIPDAGTLKRATDLGVEDMFMADPSKAVAPPVSTSVEVPGAVQPGGPPPPGMGGEAPAPAEGEDTPLAPPPAAIRLAPSPTEKGLPGPTSYLGSAKERQDAEQKARLAPIIQRITTTDPTSPAYRQAVLDYARETGQDLTSTLLGVGNQTTTYTPEPAYQVTLNGKELPGVFSISKGIGYLDGKPIPQGAKVTRVPAPGGAGGEENATDYLARLGLDERGLLIQARQVLEKGVNPPIGRTKEGARLYGMIMAAAGKMTRDASGQWYYQGKPVDIPSLAQASSDYGADSKSQGALQTNLDAAAAFSKVVDANSKLLDGVLQKIPDVGSSFFNKPIRGVASAFGSEAMSGFAALRQSVQNEYARLTSQPNLTGVLTDSARREMETIIDPNATVGQIKAALQALKLEGANRVKYYGDQIQDIRDRVSKGNPGRVEEALPPGVTVTKRK